MLEVENLYKTQYKTILTILISKFGVKNLQLIEDSIQEAFILALKEFKDKSASNLKAWILKTSSNKLIDYLRREKKYDQDGEAKVLDYYNKDADISIEQDIEQDNDLNQIFLIAALNISETDKAILSLHLVTELDIKSIAKLFLKEEKAIYQRISRVKNSIKAYGNNYDLLSPGKIQTVLPSVLKVIYLIFTAGYSLSKDNISIDDALCFEALRLGSLLTKEEATDTSEVRSLIALMLFQSSRLDSRFDEQGNIVILEEQDFTKWNKTLIQIAFYYLDQSDNYVISEYKILSRIAAVYATASNFKVIEWELILSQYDILVKYYTNPIYRLNRLVVLDKVKGTKQALKELQQLKTEKDLNKDYQIYLLEGDFLEKLNKINLSKQKYMEALNFTNNNTVKSFIEGKVKNIVISRKNVENIKSNSFNS